MPSEVTNIKSELAGIGRLLQSHPLAVPAYQRNYSWSAEQVDAFWYDLQATLISDRAYHFLGTVVLSSYESAPERLMVVDGQQRLATATMLLGAIRDECLEQGDLMLANAIEETFLYRTSFHSERREPRLLLNKNDVKFFQELVLENRLGNVPPDTTSHKLIAAAYKRLSSLLSDDLQAAGPLRGERLRSWIDLLSDSANVIVVLVSDDSDAFAFFETLNDRGLAISINDLIKGYLVGLCRDNLDLAERLWDSIDRELDDHSTASSTQFLRYWWTAHHGATRERDLFRAIRRSIREPVEALEMLEELSTAATTYAAVLDTRHAWWADYPVRCRTSLDILLRFRQDQYRPLLLAALERFDVVELTCLLENLVSFAVRSYVARQPANINERYYAEAAVSVFRGRSVNSTDALRDLSPVSLDDEAFFEAFALRDAVRSKAARYLLTALRRSQEGEFDATIFAEDAERKYRVVRLTGENTRQPTRNSSQPRSTRLGSMFLLPVRESRQLPEEFAPRLEAIRDLSPESAIPSASDIFSSHWIDERQRAMARQAVLLWPRFGTA